MSTLSVTATAFWPGDAQVLIGLAGTLAATCLLIGAATVRAARRGANLTEVARLVPDLARLLLRLSTDGTIPVRARGRIFIAIAYNVQPINLIPDFVPVIGLADNVLVTLWAVRSTVRGVGHEAIGRHWTGTPAGLAMLLRFAGCDP
jgi:uncharacterized membrane protein YkvA (DUF1232 family)